MPYKHSGTKTSSFLVKLTAILAILFFATSIALALFSKSFFFCMDKLLGFFDSIIPSG